MNPPRENNIVSSVTVVRSRTGLNPDQANTKASASIQIPLLRQIRAVAKVEQLWQALGSQENGHATLSSTPQVRPVACRYSIVMASSVVAVMTLAVPGPLSRLHTFDCSSYRLLPGTQSTGSTIW